MYYIIAYVSYVSHAGIAPKTVENFCKKIHKRLLDDFKHALVWGASTKHVPQLVGKDHILADEDVIQVLRHADLDLSVCLLLCLDYRWIHRSAYSHTYSLSLSLSLSLSHPPGREAWWRCNPVRAQAVQRLRDGPTTHMCMTGAPGLCGCFPPTQMGKGRSQRIPIHSVQSYSNI